MIRPVEVYPVLHLAGFLIPGLVHVERLPYSWLSSRGEYTICARSMRSRIGHNYREVHLLCLGFILEKVIGGYECSAVSRVPL